MATDVERLVLQLSADVKSMERGLQRARRQTDLATKAIEDRFAQMSRRVGATGEGMANNLRSAIAGIGVAVAVREVQQYADAWTSARNRLAAAGVASRDLAATQAQLVQLALQTRSDLTQTVNLYSRLVLATQDLGVSQERILGVTRTLNQAFIAGGSTTAEQASAITQLTQAFQSGVLRGEELNSVLESAPAIARAIATEFGVGVGELKRLGEAGELVVGRVFGAIEKAAPTIAGQFGSTVTTIADAFTNLRTAAIEYFGTVDQNLGVSQKLAGLIQQIANNLDLLGYAAIAAAATLGARGLPAAMGATIDRFREAIQVFGKTGEALRERTRQMQELARAEASELEVAKTRVGVANAELARTFNKLKSTRTLVQYYEELKDAERELERSTTALDEANRAAGAGEKPRMLALQSQTLATHRLQEAQSRLRRLQDATPTGLRAVLAAQEDLTQAQRDAELAAQRLEKTQGNLAQAHRASSRAAALFQATLASIGGLLAGTAGSIALFAALTFALKAIDDAFVTSAEAIENAESALEGYRSATQAIEDDTARLTAANDALRQAIETQGPAAQDVARLEVAAINQRIAANQKLQGLYKDQARIALADARAAQAREKAGQDARIAGISGRVPLGDLSKVTSQGTSGVVDLAIKEARRAVDAGEQISSEQRKLLEILTKQAATEARIRELTDVVEGRGQSDSATTAPAAVISSTTSAGSRAQASALREYRTELEAFNSTLKEVVDSKESDAVKSRAAVQALIDYARATDDVAAAFAQIPAVADILNPADAALLNSELTKMARESIVQVGTAFQDLEEQLVQRIEAIAQARRNAIAAGIGDLAQFEAAAEEAFRTFEEGMADLTDVPNPFADAIEIDQELPEFEIIGEEFRQTMRQALSDALRQGITTNDWGDALRSVVANAVAKGFEDAINKFSDFLVDILLGNGQQKGILSGAGSALASVFGGGRATGGPALPGHAYKINEQGRGEFLYMGRNAGQVLTAAQINSLSAGGGRGGGDVTINAPLVVQGDLADSTLRKVQQMMSDNNRLIASQIPGAIDARIADSRMRRRYA
jgi:tape measure domain-containing protein